MIGFQGRFIEPILDGTKTMTLRRVGSRGLPAAGDACAFRCRYDRPPFALAQIDSVEPFDLDDLTDADALTDGHANVAALRAAVADLYGDADLVCVRFHLVDAVAPVEPAQGALF